MLHPWRRLRDDHPDWHLFWEKLPDGVLGLTDHRRKHVVLDKRQLQCQRRVTLAHELIHIRNGHDGHCNENVERAIERQVARDLIPIEQLADAACWAHTLRELSDELWVDDALVVTRIDALHPAERAYLARRVAARHNEELV